MIDKAKLRELCEPGTISAEKLMTFAKAIPALLDEIEALEKKVAEARAETREKAASICDGQAWEWDSDLVIMEKNYAGHCADLLHAAAQKERE